MTTIYRVQNKNGQGCYTKGQMSKNGLDNHDDLEGIHKHPLYDVGIERMPEQQEKCGFINMKQLNRWFTKEELKRLSTNGFNVVKLEVEEITAIGETQILFTE